MCKACLKLGFDGVPAISDYALCSKRYKPRFISETRFIDEWGRILDSRPETKTTWWVGGTVETDEDMKNYVPPEPDAEGIYEMIERVLKPLRTEDVAVLCQGHAGWHMAFQVRGGIDKLLIDINVGFRFLSIRMETFIRFWTIWLRLESEVSTRLSREPWT